MRSYSDSYSATKGHDSRWVVMASDLVGRTGFEPVTSSVSGMAISSDMVAQGRVTAGRRGSAVMARRVGAGDAWRRCHLVSHWLSGTSGWGEVLMAIRIDDGRADSRP
jgi:hypothetical protein